MVQISLLSREWFLRYTPLRKLSRNSVNNFVANSTNVTHARTHEQTYERLGQNYIPLIINAGDKITDNMPNIFWNAEFTGKKYLKDKSATVWKSGQFENSVFVIVGN